MIFRSLLFAFYFCAVLIGKAQTTLPAQSAGKWGLLNATTYDITVPYLYSSLHEAPDGSFWAVGTPQNEQETVYFDSKGREFLRLQNPKGLKYEVFAGNLARFTTPENELQGFIDRTGKEALPARYTKASDFADGVAFVREQGTDFFKIIDIQGKTVASLDKKYHTFTRFSEGRAFIMEGDALPLGDGLPHDFYEKTIWGNIYMIDKAGNVIADFTKNDKIKVAHNFKKDLNITVVGTPAVNYDGYEGKFPFASWGVIDRAGKVVVPIEYDRVEIEPNGNIVATHASGTMTVFDSAGKVLFNGEEQKKYYRISPLIGNRFRFVQANDQEANWGVVDASNAYKIVVPTQYQEVYFKPPTDFWAVEKWNYLRKLDAYLGDSINYSKEGKITFFTYTRSVVADKPLRVQELEVASSLHSFDYDGKWGFLDKNTLTIQAVGYDSIPTQTSYTNLIPAQKNGKWGFLNRRGEIVIKPQFDEIEESSLLQGTIAVRKADKWGLISKSGKTVLPFEYDLISEAKPYGKATEQSSKTYREAKKKGGIGLIDVNGKVIVPFAFQLIKPVAEDYFIGTNSFGKQGISDYSGKNLINYSYEWITKMKGDNNLFLVKKDDKIGIIDLNEKIIVPLLYDKVTPVPNASNLLYVYQNNKVGIIQTDATAVLPTEYEAIEVKKEFFKVKKNGKWGVMNSAKELFVPCEYDEIGDGYFFFPRAFVRFQKNGLMGMLRGDGKEALPAIYDMINSINEPFFAIKAGKLGVVDAKNNIIVPFEYNHITPIYTDRAMYWHVTKNNLDGIMGDKKELIIPLKYDELGYFSIEEKLPMGFKQQGKWGYFNAKQKTVIPTTYTDAKRFELMAGKAVAIVKKADKWGVINEKNKTVIPFQYDELYSDSIEKGTFYAKKDGKDLYIDLQGRELKKTD